MNKNLIVVDSYNSQECELNLTITVRNKEELLTVVKTQYSYIDDSINYSKSIDTDLKQRINNYFKHASFIGILEELALNRINKKQIIITL
jgi:hypothetical protein